MSTPTPAVVAAAEAASTTYGALVQLVTHESARQRVPDTLPIQHTVTLFASAPVTFGETITQPIPRQSEMIHSCYAHVRIGALPAGVTWKPNLFARLIRSATLRLGGQPICSLRAEDTMLKLQMGLLTLPNGTPYKESLVANQPPSSEQEFCIPLFMKEEMGLSIPLIAIQYHTVELEVVFNPFSELVMPSMEGALDASLPPPPSFTCALRATGEVYDIDTRRQLFAGSHTQSLFAIQSETLAISGRPLDAPGRGDKDTIRVQVNSNHIHATAFLHLTDEHGLEIPHTCVDTITVFFNSTQRHHLSGYEARHLQWANIPWRGTKPPTSSNLYSLSYWTGRQFRDGDPRKPFGANFARISSVDYHIKLLPSAPLNLRITLAHDIQNTFYVKAGTGGFPYANQYSISNLDGVIPQGASAAVADAAAAPVPS